ncbi:response regulator [Fimbriiglobus ruber]|uniref:Signal transduction response regulator n=1 Tax=Fimbriiglobus ruber TaxID=1908690 RepID=A0A225D7J9_9BACT|nr:response regulator [Fimbriiglobus ruber]OWK35614.1 Signal transduction response regulator [Fimbriiglobus ruber]
MPTLLVVDDERENIELLARRLGRRGFTVIAAASAEEALAKAVADHPDAILMDVKMPDVDGYEATRRLKALPATRHIPVVTLTAHAMQEDCNQALAAGADEYETKPVDLDRLVTKLRTLLAKTASATDEHG